MIDGDADATENSTVVLSDGAAYDDDGSDDSDDSDDGGGGMSEGEGATPNPLLSYSDLLAASEAVLTAHGTYCNTDGVCQVMVAVVVVVVAVVVVLLSTARVVLTLVRLFLEMREAVK